MDFFHHQDRAKSRTLLLVLLYCLSLAGLTGILVAIVLSGYAYAETEPDPATMFFVIGNVLAIVITGSVCKTAQLTSGGGRAIAETLGGRQVCSATTNPAERRLYNIVEEMALASGVPVPTLYIMDTEKSINAFAAGFSPNAAVIGVNRGTVDLLTRDELQGVIAHEFSHILNGDMRMNTRLIGILYGLQLLAIYGYYIMRSVRYFALGGQLGLVLSLVPIVAGIILMSIGYIGVLFSAIITAAISRQREYLADASAVLFTRNPDGIVGALKKIGTPGIGSNITDAHAAEMSHLFFGNACALFSLGGLLATHPDLTTRIKRIDPHFDGRFPKRSNIRPAKLSKELSRKQTSTRSQPIILPTIDSKQSVLEHIGELTIANVLTAGTMLRAIPKDVATSAVNPLTAQAVFFAMLLDTDGEIQARQLNQIQTKGSDFLLKETLRLYPLIYTLPEHEKIPLAQQVSATLREITEPQYKRFTTIVDLLIAANKRMELFDFTIKAALLRDLDIHFGKAKQLRVRHTAMEQVRLSVRTALSFLAYSGHISRQESEEAFGAAMQELGLTDAILLPAETTLMQFERSLRVLSETCPALKKQIFAAFMTCVWFDGKITPKESALIRAIAAMLTIPMPVLS